MFEPNPDLAQSIVQGDQKVFVFTLTDNDGNAIDLTNASLIKFMAKSSTALKDSRAIFDKTCSVDAPATDGICRTTITTVDTENAGEFDAEILIVFTDGTTNRDTQFILTIKPRVRRAIV